MKFMSSKRAVKAKKVDYCIGTHAYSCMQLAFIPCVQLGANTAVCIHADVCMQIALGNSLYFCKGIYNILRN